LTLPPLPDPAGPRLTSDDPSPMDAPRPAPPLSARRPFPRPLLLPVPLAPRFPALRRGRAPLGRPPLPRAALLLGPAARRLQESGPRPGRPPRPSRRAPRRRQEGTWARRSCYCGRRVHGHGWNLRDAAPPQGDHRRGRSCGVVGVLSYAFTVPYVRLACHPGGTEAKGP